MFNSIRLKKKKKIIGLMSGSSLDGIDVALLEVSGYGPKTEYHLLESETLRLVPQVRAWLLEIRNGSGTSPGRISQLNYLLGELFARAAEHICRKAGIPLESIDLIGSHGLTIAHLPEATEMLGIPVRSSFQIGEPSVIAERTGITTVADFRSGDLAAGGQGSPLMAYVDYLLFRSRSRGRILLNLGGVANLTGLLVGCSPESVLAFDSGPGNCLLDAYVRSATQGREQFDFEGRYARRGTVHEALLERLSLHPYFRRKPPKTCDPMTFPEEFLKTALKETGHPNTFDTIATLTRFTASTVAKACEGFLFPTGSFEELIVSGGGAKNSSILDEIRRLLPGLSVSLTDDYSLPADIKKAVGFALLANDTLHGQPNNLPSVTGARHPVVMGKILPGRNSFP